MKNYFQLNLYIYSFKQVILQLILILNSYLIINHQLLIKLLNISTKKQQANRETHIKIGQFISIASQLALSACEIIKQTSQNPNLLKYEKAVNDPVTQADYQVQTMIIKGFNKFFPKLRIIGEETIDYKGQIKVNYQAFKLDFYPQNNKFCNLEVPYSQICVWIDPIDCTKGFIAKKMDYVTTLIGMSRNKEAYVGIVGKPYTFKNSKTVYQPAVSIGVAQSKQAYRYSLGQKWQAITSHAVHNPVLVTTSRQRADKTFYDYMNSIKGKQVFAGGAGNKIMMVVDGQADIMAYLNSYTSKWDSCAGQAIVKALGGLSCTPWGDQLIYDPNNTNYCNQQGHIVTFNKDLLASVIKYFKKFPKSQVKSNI